MIYLLVVLGCLILFLIANTVLNRLLVSRIEHHNGLYRLNAFPILFLVLIVLAAIILPRTIVSNTRYNSFENYLLWTEGYRLEGFLGVDAYYENECGVVYSYGNQTASGFAAKEEGGLKHEKLKFLKNKILQTDTAGISMALYGVADKNLCIFIFTQMDAADFQIAVNGEISENYLSTNHMRQKINVIENTSSYEIVLEGQSFTITS